MFNNKSLKEKRKEEERKLLERRKQIKVPSNESFNDSEPVADVTETIKSDIDNNPVVHKDFEPIVIPDPNESDEDRKKKLLDGRNKIYNDLLFKLQSEFEEKTKASNNKFKSKLDKLKKEYDQSLSDLKEDLTSELEDASLSEKRELRESYKKDELDLDKDYILEKRQIEADIDYELQGITEEAETSEERVKKEYNLDSESIKEGDYTYEDLLACQRESENINFKESPLEDYVSNLEPCNDFGSSDDSFDVLQSVVVLAIFLIAIGLFLLMLAPAFLINTVFSNSSSLVPVIDSMFSNPAILLGIGLSVIVIFNMMPRMRGSF